MLSVRCDPLRLPLCTVVWTEVNLVGPSSVLSVVSVSWTRTVRRCCPPGSSLDVWYTCQPTQGADTFTDLLATYQHDAAVLQVSVSSITSCPLSQRKEFEVINIPQDEADEDYLDDVLYVILNDSLVEMDERSVEESVMRTRYECLIQEDDPPVLVSVVCDPEAGGSEGAGGSGGAGGAQVTKCCPPSQSLSPDLECVEVPGPPLPPRAVLSPSTLREVKVEKHKRMEIMTNV